MTDKNTTNVAFFEVDINEQVDLAKVISETKELAGVQVKFFPEKLTKENADTAKDCEVISVFINSIVNKEVIDALPDLKLITTRSTGFDHIDCAYAASKGIKVANVPTYGSRTVAEYTFALILGLSRKVLAASYQVKSRQGFDISSFMGFDLQGKTIGIIGTGHIGLNVAKIAKGFDMEILAFDLHPNEDQAKKFGFTYASFEDVLSKSDVVTLHVPYNANTRHLINKDNIKKFKPGSLLINTARGEVCDTEAIFLGIREKILAGVGLDVLEGERSLKEEGQFFMEKETITMDAAQMKTLLENHVLIGRPEVFITPHIAFFTKEAQREIINTSVANVAAFADGKDLNLVKI